MDPFLAAPMLDWLFLSQIAVSMGIHHFPLSHTFGSNTVKMAPVADVNGEQGHFLEFAWDVPSSGAYNNISFGANNPWARKLRQQLSINTCKR